MPGARRFMMCVVALLAVGLVVVTAWGASPVHSTAATADTSSATRTRRTTSTTPATSSTVSITTAPTPTAPPAPPAPTTTISLQVDELPRDKGPIPIISRIPTTDPVVFITIDDGYLQDPAVLDFVRAHNLPVTLFLNQGPMRQNPEYFRAFQAAGNPIEAHTARHPDLRKLDRDDQSAAVCSQQGPIAETFGVAPTLFRPPYGNWTPHSLAAGADCGITAFVLWTAALNNGEVQVQKPPLRAGDIILAHFRPDLLVNLQNLVVYLQMVGLRPARLADYVNAGLVNAGLVPGGQPSPPPGPAVAVPVAPAPPA